MATIYKRLLKRVLGETELREILIRLRNGNDYDLIAKSGIFVTPDNFKNGEIVVNRRKVGNDVSYHVEQSKKLNELCSFILNELASRKKNEITKEWLTKCIDRFFHPEKYLPKTRKKQKSFYELSEEYLSKKEFSVSHTKSIRVLVRDVARYEGFVYLI